MNFLETEHFFVSRSAPKLADDVALFCCQLAEAAVDCRAGKLPVARQILRGKLAFDAKEFGEQGFFVHGIQ